MRIQIRNCVTDIRFKDLRRKGTPVFKPSILGSVLVPGAIRIVESDLFDLTSATYLSSLVKSGSCEATEIGVGPVNFDAWLSSFAADLPVEEPTPVVEEVVEIVEESAPELEEEPSLDELLVEVDEPSEESAQLYTEEDLSSMKNADLRAIILEMDPDASLGNKSKKKLISLLLELQNA